MTPALCIASISGCIKSSYPTFPLPTRLVGVTVEDTTGARVTGVSVYALGVDLSNDLSVVPPVTTDGAGVASFNLTDGVWAMYINVWRPGAPALVAGPTGTVGPRPAGHPDSILFRLVLRPESIVRGRIMLRGEHSLAGSTVTVVGNLSFAETSTDGGFVLDGFAPGSWIAIAEHAGFQTAPFTIRVPAPGDTVYEGIELQPLPTP